MTTIDELHEVIATEAQLTEELVGVLRRQQESIIHNWTEDLNGLVEKSEELMQPLQILEKERARLAGLVVLGTEEAAGTQGRMVASSELLNCLDEHNATSIAAVIGRLRAASQEVLRINRLNKPLLEHSQRFVKQTLRAATDDYKKNLVDRKM